MVEPATMALRDVARVVLESDRELSLGWILALLHRPSERFSWGFSYRSELGIDYGGKARYSQILSGDPAFDASVRAALPFDVDLPIETSVEFPDLAILAVAYQVNPILLLELDVHRAGWSSFDRIEVRLPSDPALGTTIVSSWEDSSAYRFGLRWSGQGNGEWRAGVYFDETPQPEETLGPLLPDADRVGYSVGYGTMIREVQADLALAFVDFDPRSTRSNVDGFDGSYGASRWLFCATFGW